MSAGGFPTVRRKVFAVVSFGGVSARLALLEGAAGASLATAAGAGGGAAARGEGPPVTPGTRAYASPRPSLLHLQLFSSRALFRGEA